MSDLAPRNKKEQQILDAAIEILGMDGITGLTMRAVSAKAGVALGLMNYYFADKTSLIAAALSQVGDADLELVPLISQGNPLEWLTYSLRRVADAEFLEKDHLGLRLQLWALSVGDPQFSEINRESQARYRDALAAIIAAARPDLEQSETVRRAADILIMQNGMWLTSVLIQDDAATARVIQHTVDIALAP